MKFTLISQIQAHRFGGNHLSDSAAFDAIDAFIDLPTTSLADKAEALRVISDKGMGIGREPHISDEDLVAEHYGQVRS